MKGREGATNVESVRCRLCGDARTTRIGVLCDSDFFAGRVLRAPLTGGYLWGCAACQSMFRHPVLADSVYLRLYAEGAADEWGAYEGRRDYAIVRELIEARSAGASVLDVGCGGGEFLVTLSKDVLKCGVEPSTAAAAVARHRGVSMLAQTLDGLPPGALFDFITMIDVIEHMANPAELLDAAVRHLKPGGSLIVSTGDPAHALWRGIFLSRFWYASHPEHISFPSLAYFDTWRKTHRLDAPKALRFNYLRLPFWMAVLSLGSQLLYLASPAALNRLCRMIDRLRRAPEPRRRLFTPGGPGVFKDHHVVQIQRPS